MNVLITGGTGFLGGSIIKFLLACKKELSIYLFCRDKHQAELLFDRDSRIFFVEGSLEGILENETLKKCKIDYIIHCAAPTQSSYMIANPVETADAIVIGTRNILEFAQKNSVESMVYLSSMEVFGAVADTGVFRKENELGDIDLTMPRSCYSLGKRMAEHYCHLYCQQYGVPVKIARLAQVFGKGVRCEDNRVFMQFARSAINEKNIILKTDGLSMGNYCATEDAVNAIITILENGVNGEVYNVVNEQNTMTIREMAQLVASKIAGDKIKVEIIQEDNSKTGYAPKTGLRMSAEKLRALGWTPQKSLIEMYEDVIEELTKCKEK